MSACYTAHTKYTIRYIRTLSTKKQLVVSCIFVICFTATKLSSQKYLDTIQFFFKVNPDSELVQINFDMTIEIAKNIWLKKWVKS